jgi:aldehyde dehydrogenase (NAD+)
VTTAIDATVERTRAAIAALPPTAAYIDGEWVRPAESQGSQHVHVDPATGEELGTWTLPSPADVDHAVESAARAQQTWCSMPPATRRDLLLALADEMTRNAVTLTSLVSLEMGMPYKASQAGVLAAAEWFRYYAGYADKLEGAVPPIGSPAIGLDYTRLSPYGVVAAIIPWNGPIMALALKVAPAMAAGNAVVLKPSDLAPFSALHFGSLVAAAGLPPGVVNVVPGGPEVGARLCANERIGLISFTGGGVAGRAVSEAAAARHIPTVLELGGKSASVVFEDANIDVTAKLAAVLGIAQNSGQGCFLPTRLLVQRSVYDRTLDGVVAAAKRFRLGSPFDAATNMGPIVDARSRDRILEVIERARDRGDGRLVYGGSRAGGPLSQGNFVEPTVFADVDPASPLGQDEVFGPVLSVIPFEGEADAVAIANGTRYGLAGYVWTADLGRAHRFADALDAGYVSVNSMAALPPQAPFGGWKASGHGVEGGLEGLREYVRIKNIYVRW